MIITLGVFGASLWILLFFLPWRPWSTREQIDSDLSLESISLEKLTVLIPARNEADTIARTLKSIEEQGSDVRVVLVNDQSTDETAQTARDHFPANRLKIIDGQERPAGWAGKLWALEQGRKHIETDYVLLMDADIELKPGILKTLFSKLVDNDLGFVSTMAALQMGGFWERLLMPAYIHFFKLLFPFRLNNSASRHFASAAGGFILTKRQILDQIGGFSVLKDALIDDCSLAALIKSYGYRGWTGLSHSVTSHRAYNKLSEIWNLVARFAFTYLRYSVVLLGLTTLLMIACFWAIPIALFLDTSLMARLILWSGLAAMLITYLPTLIYYRLNPLWALSLPIIGTLYLAMTWTSALRYWRGQRTEWKGRIYDRQLSESE